MTEQELFDVIDFGIASFKQKEGHPKQINISKKPKSDWLQFNWRQLTWKANDLDYLIEIFPTFDNQENITSWTLYSAVYYDLDNKRYYSKYETANNMTLEFIAENIVQLLETSFMHITVIPIERIPFSEQL
jgi:hypothetical protein